MADSIEEFDLPGIEIEEHPHLTVDADGQKYWGRIAVDGVRGFASGDDSLEVLRQGGIFAAPMFMYPENGDENGIKKVIGYKHPEPSGDPLSDFLDRAARQRNARIPRDQSPYAQDAFPDV